MSSATAAARISVLVPAYNAERYILPSVLSVLAQTCEDFELLVVDDCSTDRTPDLLSSIRDRRLRVLRNPRNLGIVGTLNHAMAEARGRYIARMDADDYCLPTRFARQARFLDQHPDIVLVGAGTFLLEDGRVRHERRRSDPDPAVLRWQFLVSNPIGHSTMMFRADAVASLDAYLREDFRYAEDFDFSHRLLHVGDLAVLPENLVIYRLHQQNLTRTGRPVMIAKAAAVLARAYAGLLGGDRTAEATLVAEHLMAGEPVRSLAVLERLGGLLDQLATAFVAAHALSEGQAARVAAHAGEVWWAAVQASLRAGAVVPAALGHRCFPRGRESRPPLHRIARSVVSGVVRGGGLRVRQGAAPRAAASDALDRMAARFEAVPSHPDDPPSLYAVVDAAAQDQVQAVFDRYGLRPVYVVDHAAASQPAACEALRELLERRACAIGACLRPEDEPPSVGPGAEEARERGLRSLVGLIQARLGVSPLFVMDEGHGLGPRAPETLARLGFAVEFSTPPAGGDAQPGRAAGDGILSVPMTRALRVPPPHPGGTDKAHRLVRAMVGRGCRVFTLRCQGGGCQSGGCQGGAGTDVPRIEALCRFFFEEMGGMPGNPADLVPQGMRERIWPRPDRAGPMARPDAVTVPSGE